MRNILAKARSRKRIAVFIDSIVPTSGGLQQTLTNASLIRELGYKVEYVLPLGVVTLDNLQRVTRYKLWPFFHLKYFEHTVIGVKRHTWWQFIGLYLDKVLVRKYKSNEETIEIVSNPHNPYFADNSGKAGQQGPRLRIANHYASAIGMQEILGVKGYSQLIEAFDKFLFEDKQQASDAELVDKTIAGKQIVISPCIDEANMSRHLGKSRNQGFSSDGPNLVMVASLQERKNQLLVIESIRLLKEKFPSIVAHFIGDDTGKYARECRKTITSYGLERHCRIYGHMDKFAPFISQADGYLNVSKDEGVSLALRQAVYLGVPCLITNLPGSMALLDGENGGFVLHENSAHQLAELIVEMLNSRLEMKRRADFARKRYSSQYSREFNMNRWAEVLASTE